MQVSGHTQTIALIGSPVEHSLSPAMHTQSFNELGVDCVYLAYDIEPQDLESVAVGMKKMGFVGYNVTMPHKTFIPKYLDELSDAAELMGAVNTVAIKQGKAIGHNTDGAGFMRNLKENGVDVIGKKMTIAGAGGAATAIEIQAALDGVKEISIFNIHDKFWANAEETVRKINEKTDCKATLYDLDDKEKLREELSLIHISEPTRH